MIPFNVLFGMKDEIEYHGKKINKYFELNKKGRYILRFTFVSTCSTFIQAIVIFLKDFKGQIVIDGEDYKIPRTRFPKLNFFEDTAPKQFDISVVINQGSLLICNGSDPIGTKQICHALSFGCAMVIEKLAENRFRFYCNDHENDDDLNDLIFEMEIRSQGEVSPV